MIELDISFSIISDVKILLLMFDDILKTFMRENV